LSNSARSLSLNKGCLRPTERLPEVQAGDYFGGVGAGVFDVLRRVKHEPNGLQALPCGPGLINSRGKK